MSSTWHQQLSEGDRGWLGWVGGVGEAWNWPSLSLNYTLASCAPTPRSLTHNCNVFSVTNSCNSPIITLCCPTVPQVELPGDPGQALGPGPWLCKRHANKTVPQLLSSFQPWVVSLSFSASLFHSLDYSLKSNDWPNTLLESAAKSTICCAHKKFHQDFSLFRFIIPVLLFCLLLYWYPALHSATFNRMLTTLVSLSIWNSIIREGLEAFTFFNKLPTSPVQFS